MFHLASVIFWTIVQPVSLAIFLLAAGVAALFFAWHRLALVLCGTALFVLVLAGWTTFGALLLHPLEERISRPADPPQRVDGIVLLGGGFESSVNLVRGGYELNSSGDRPVEVAILARRYPEARILISGGSGLVFQKGEGDADTAPRLLKALGVDAHRIEVEGRSRDTYENAVFSKRIANPQAGETWLLVTSAFHMPRSVGVFRRIGFPVTPWPVDYMTSGREGFGLAQDHVIDSLGNTTIATREWIALVAYRLAGRTASFFPAPQSGQGL